MRIHADSVLDLVACHSLKSQKVELLHEKDTYVSKYGVGKKKVKKTYRYLRRYGTEAFLKGRKPDLFINFGPFSYYWIQIRIRRIRSRIHESKFIADPCVSGFTTLSISNYSVM
jgi:hypothetical protein